MASRDRVGTAAAGGVDGPPPEAVSYEPLYKRVKNILVARIADGRWQAGQLIPNEFQIAAELDVSQGTVRKALHEMTADNLLVRQQGRGTFVSRHDEERILFRFFRLASDAGVREFPDSSVMALAAGAANDEEAAALGIATGDPVWRLRRRRTLGGRPVIAETVILPQALFPGLDRLDSVPNNVYGLYSARFGVTVVRAAEKLKAVAATLDDARVLDCPFGVPLLQVDRRAFAIDGRVCEWRVSRCLTEHHHYISDLK